MRDLFLIIIVIGVFAVAACENAKTTIAMPLNEEVVYVFTSNSSVPANFGNRTAADAYCTSTYGSSGTTWGISCTNHVALVSYDGTDEPADFPTTVGLPTDRPFVTPSDIELAADFDDFMDGMNTGMSGDGAFHSAAWTGFETGGVATAFDCDNWTNAGATSGNSVNTLAATNWNNTTGCSGTKSVICLCWE